MILLPEKLLGVIAEFDARTEGAINEIQQALRLRGFVGSQTKDAPPHITLGLYDVGLEADLSARLDTVRRVPAFDLFISHIGLFGLNVLFLAPDTTRELLALRDIFAKGERPSEWGWTPHITLLIDGPEAVQKAVPVVAERFRGLSARVERLTLNEFWPARQIKQCPLSG